MTKNRKKLLFGVLGIFILSTIMFVFTLTGKTVNAISIDNYVNANGVTIQKEYSTPIDVDENEQKGVLVSTTNSNSFLLFNNFSGLFSVDLRVLSDSSENNDFDALTFTFTDCNYEKNSFKITLTETTYTENSQEVTYLSVKTVYKGVISYYTPYHIDFDNSENVHCVSFDPYSMECYFSNGGVEKLLVDFNDNASMISAFKANVALTGFESFNVSVKTEGVKSGKTAKYMLYSLSGESLAGKNIENSVGPQLINNYVLNNGVINQPYTFNKCNLKTMDLIDGEQDFNGTITVYNPEKEIVEVSGNSFLPTIAGMYEVVFAPKDLSGISGKTTTDYIIIYGGTLTGEFDFAYPINDNIVQGGKVLLPYAKAKTTLNNNSNLYATITIKDNQGQTLKTVENCSSVYEFSFNNNESIICEYKVTDWLGNAFTKSFTINNNTTAISYTQIEDQHVFTQIIIPDAYKDGNVLNFEVVAPNGKVSSFKKANLNQEGLWCVKYFYDTDKVFEVYFNVIVSPSDLWDTYRGMSLTDKTRTPDYMDLDITGLLFKGSSTYSNAVYKNIIDLSSYTPDDTLIKFLVTPQFKDSLEIQELQVVLTDIYDSTNTISLVIRRDPYYYKGTSACYIQIGDNFIDPNVFVHYLGSSSFWGKWDGGKVGSENIIYNPYFSNPISLSMDYATNRFYFSNGISTGYVDPTDPAITGEGKEWKGFTTGEVELKFVYTTLDQTANTLLLTVDNLDLSGDIVKDEVAPSVQIDVDYSAIPNAKVNSMFPIFDAYGMDSISGKINNVNYKVYYIENGEYTEILTSQNGYFVPDKAGHYQIYYFATDISNNVGSNFVDVYAYSEIDEIVCLTDIDSYYPTTVKLGEYITVTDIACEGGSGKLDIQTKLYIDNEEIDLCDKLEMQGGSVFKVEYTVSDFLKTQKTFVKEISILPNSDAIISHDTIPNAVIVNKEFTVPTATACSYASGTKQSVEVKTYIDGVEYTNSTYTPLSTGNDEFTLKYVAGSTVIEKVVKVIKTVSGKGFIKNYFVPSNANVSVGWESGVNGLVVSVANDGSLSFANALSAENFSMNFWFNKEENNIGKTNFIFTDSKNSNETVKLSIYANPNTAKGGALISLNGGNGVAFSGDFEKLSFNGLGFYFNGTSVYDNEDVLLFDITKTLEGVSFDGFTSGLVYLTIEFEDVNSASKFYIKQIGNQSIFETFSRDTVPPVIVYYDEFKYSVEYGDTYTLPNAKLFDILDSKVTFNCTVTSPSGKEIFNGRYQSGYQFAINEYGTYNVVFEVSDSDRGGNEIYLSITVFNKTEPTITLSSGISLTAKVDSALAIPSAEVGAGNTLFVYVIKPSGAFVNLTGLTEYTPDEKGVYKLVYYAYNSDNACSVETFYIEVK